MKKYTADFETATWLDKESFVWAWAVCEINNDNNLIIDNSIESFFDFLEKESGSVFYFHNLKFDSQFIIYYLLKNGFEHITNIKERRDKTFTTLINKMGVFYSITIYFKVGKSKKKVKKVTIIDSLKIIPFSVDKVAKSFGLEISKLKIDYNEPRERGHVLTSEEKDYITNDVRIMAKALKVLFDEGLDKMTIGSNALHDYKKIIGQTRFNKLFPTLSFKLDEELRKSYKGGFTYLNSYWKDKDTGEGITLDVNSLYPSCMVAFPLPYGDPIYYEGEYQEDKFYPLYIQKISCSFEIKKNKIPTIQFKKHFFFAANEYVKSTKGEIEVLTLTSVDLKLFLEQYDVYDLKYIEGWKFKATKGIFEEYINKWTDRKIKAGKEGNLGQRQLAKLMLNSLYGKFATTLIVQEKIPYLEDDIVKYKLGEEGIKDGLYLPVGCFITAYARNKTIRTSQAITDYSINKYGIDKYIYSDTDSISTTLSIEEVKQFCEIDDFELGKWAHENTFDNAKFIRQKTYLKLITNKEGEKEIHITCAGMPKSCYDNVTWDNFKEGFSCGGKLTYKQVKGGVKLVDTDFTIKTDKKLKKEINDFKTL